MKVNDGEQQLVESSSRLIIPLACFSAFAVVLNGTMIAVGLPLLSQQYRLDPVRQA